jgi:hypothetical protein
MGAAVRALLRDFMHNDDNSSRVMRAAMHGLASAVVRWSPGRWWGPVAVVVVVDDDDDARGDDASLSRWKRDLLGLGRYENYA